VQRLGNCKVEGAQDCKGKNDCKAKGGCRAAHCDEPNPDWDRAGANCCKGFNDCKALGNCKTAQHACKGMNACKAKRLQISGLPLIGSRPVGPADFAGSLFCW